MQVALVTLAVWSLLLAAPLVAPLTGEDGAVPAVYALALALLVASRRPRGDAPVRPWVLGLGVASGYASFPSWVAGTVAVGLTLGLTPRAPAPPAAGDPALWIVSLLLAPALEELLYRERLLDALVLRWGAAAAVIATSALFAIPHLEPWHILATFLVGLGLGAARLMSRSVGLCIALHVGLNLASLSGGAPPLRLALQPPAAAAAGLALFAGALLMRRGGIRWGGDLVGG